jgi:hypothetical protein
MSAVEALSVLEQLVLDFVSVNRHLIKQFGFYAAKHDSATALSQQFPRRLMLDTRWAKARYPDQQQPRRP